MSFLDRIGYTQRGKCSETDIMPTKTWLRLGRCLEVGKVLLLEVLEDRTD